MLRISNIAKMNNGTGRSAQRVAKEAGARGRPAMECILLPGAFPASTGRFVLDNVALAALASELDHASIPPETLDARTRQPPPIRLRISRDSVQWRGRCQLRRTEGEWKRFPFFGPSQSRPAKAVIRKNLFGAGMDVGEKGRRGRGVRALSPGLVCPGRSPVHSQSSVNHPEL